MSKLLALALVFLSVSLNASAHESFFKGIYTWGAEVDSFRSCNDKTAYWVSFDWAGIEMHEHYKAHHQSPYQPMYLEFRGQLLNEVVDGFAEHYDGLVRISDVKTYTFSVPAKCK